MVENKNLDVLKQHMEIVGKEREEQKKLLYDKLYRFLSIDLTIFPIITTIFFIYLSGLNNTSSLLSFISFFIAIFYKFFLILFKLKSFITPTSAFDGVNESEREEKLIFFSKEKADKEDKYYQDLIKYVNHSIFFTMTSITISLSSLFQIYLFTLTFISNDVIIICVNILDICLLIIAIFLLILVRKQPKIVIFLKKFHFWKKK